MESYLIRHRLLPTNTQRMNVMKAHILSTCETDADRFCDVEVDIC